MRAGRTGAVEPSQELIDALDPRPRVRIQAIGALAADRVPDAAELHALRSALLLDPHAHVRRTAAGRLARLVSDPRSSSPAIATWLLEASRDAQPSVREAAYHALARCDGVGGVLMGDLRARLREAALEEPIWWARRTAVYAIARLGRAPGEVGEVDLARLETLREVLGDPFWRVRHSAIQTIATLGRNAPEIRGLVMRWPAPDDVRTAALEYLRRQWSGAGPLPEPARALDRPALRASAFWDEDPAVMTARLERQPSQATTAELVELLATSHRPLQRLAVQELGRRGTPRALEAALLWLEEPRLSQATAAVKELLAVVGGPAEELAEELVAGVGGKAPGPQSLAWALRVAGEHEPEAHRAHLARHLGAAEPVVRRAALVALAQVDATGEEERALAALAGDGSAEVREAWLRIGLDQERRGWLGEALAWEYARQPPTVRRLMVRVALTLRDERSTLAERVGRTLAAAREDGDWQVRLLLAEAGSGAPTAVESGCPLLAVAATGPEGLVDLLARNRSAEGRRAAWARLDECWAKVAPEVRQEALLAASTANDPWLRARAAARLGPRPREVETALRLFLDEEHAVRAAAVTALMRLPDELVAAALTWLPRGHHAERKAAHAWLARGLEAADVSRLAVAAVREPPEVAAFLRDLVGAGAPGAPAAVHPAARSVAPPPSPGKRPSEAGRQADEPPLELRPLGATGIALPPLILSGAHEPSLAALSRAVGKGASAFFWEPRYLALSRFLVDRRRQPLRVVAGSFEASAAGIRRDVERALRRLRRERIDVFLLFWVRSARRLGDEGIACLERLQREGKIAAAGFSTHDRSLAVDALLARRWDAVMLRHSAAHPGAEQELLPLAARLGTGVLGFSALCYGRMLRRHGDEAAPTAADCYRYSLTQPGVTAVISAPRRREELEENLAVLAAPALPTAALERLRRHGAGVHRASRELNALVRRTEMVPQETRALLDQLLDGSLDREPGMEDGAGEDLDRAEEET